MRTYNATAARLRILADAIDAGNVDPDDARIQATGGAEYAIVHENEPERVTW